MELLRKAHAYIGKQSTAKATDIPTHSDILQKAQSLLSHWRTVPYPQVLAPSQLWRGNIDQVLSKAEGHRDLVSIFRHQQENNGFSFQRSTDDPEFALVCDSYCRKLAENGFPLDSLPFEIQESPLSSPNLVAEKYGRKVSVMFFWFLTALLRVRSYVPEPKTILELGGGYGGLARLARMQWPRVKYIIVDLSESLFFSYLYIAANFPETRVVWPKNEAELDAVLESGNYDFLMVSCAFGEGLYGRFAVDVTINTASLGEMSQETVDWYLRFIQDHMDTRYFYSANRYGHFPELIHHRDQSSCSIHLDPYWRMHLWDIHGPHSCTRLDPAFPRSLEYFAERLPKDIFTPEMRQMMSAQLYKSAILRLHKDTEWERLMSESVRYYPSRDNVTQLTTFLRDHNFIELEYYEKLLASL